MPEMELSSISDHLGPEGVWPRIWGYMLWPSDESRRRSFVASAYANLLASIAELPNELPDPLGQGCFELVREKVGCDLLHDFHERAGGWPALSPALNTGIDTAKAVAGLRTAGLVLAIIRATPGNGTLNKAIHLIGCAAEWLAIRASGRTQVRAVWHRYKTVAHLGWALCAVTAEPEQDESAELAKFLAIARDYQRFATTYTAPGQLAPLITPGQAWMVPDNLSLPDPPPQLPLPDAMLAALREYRAPQ
jgi:hypothetical protein